MIELQPLGVGDVELEVTHCGICHSDVHLIDNNWRISRYPLVPGHEIVGVVRAVGDQVTTLALGDRVGVGWQSRACMRCELCTGGDENLCREMTPTCVGRPGGFADRVRVAQQFAFPLPDALSSEYAAPLMCAGATVHAPLARAQLRPGARVGIIGVGGLGHLALQFARGLGCEVTAFSSNEDKEALARSLGATRFVRSRDVGALKRERGRYDFILSTVHAELDWAAYIKALRPKGTLCFVGVPGSRASVPVGVLVDGQRSVAGSLIAGREQLRAMLAAAVRHDVRPVIERAPWSGVNDAVARVRAGTPRFRVVLDRGDWSA